MKTQLDFNVLDYLEKIHHFSKNAQLLETSLNEVSEEISEISNYLMVNKIEAVLFANAFVMWFENSTFKNVFQHLGLKEFHILKYREAIENLYARNLLYNKDKKKIMKYEVPQSIIFAISKGKMLTQIPHTTRKTFGLIDALEEFDTKSDELFSEVISFFEFKNYIEELVSENLSFPLFAEIKKLKLDVFETYFLLDVIWDAITRGDNFFNTNVQITIDEFFPRKSNSIQKFNEVIKGETKLTQLNLIELSKEQFANRTLAKLSNEMINFLSEKEGITIDNFSEGNKKLIQFNQIKSKELFYNSKEIAQLKIIENALQTDTFAQMQKRLEERNLPKGMAILLHGLPGTGKTETVYQLAKQTQRNIYKVDISETKSMWFGESQKLIKKVFNDYYEMMKTESNCPILLFNEADGIISKRKELGNSNTAETENAIQNIILEEMENFEGILFATTNLVKNMDAAFERRFLFKVQFDQPSLENAAKIWKNKLPFLTDEEARRLAERFPFSGGEIENITRKCVMNDLLTGSEIRFQQVVEFCKQEKWTDKKNVNKIGF